MANRPVISVRDPHTLARRFGKMANNTGRKVTRPSLERGAEYFVKRILRPGFGFKDRTWKLRKSVKWEHVTQRTLRPARKATVLQITAEASNKRGQQYAGFVERKRRTKDTRTGPPYWFGRAWRNAQKQVYRLVAKEVTKRVAQQGRKR